jgi:hypothetical protein
MLLREIVNRWAAAVLRARRQFCQEFCEQLIAIKHVQREPGGRVAR